MRCFPKVDQSLCGCTLKTACLTIAISEIICLAFLWFFMTIRLSIHLQEDNGEDTTSFIYSTCGPSFTLSSHGSIIKMRSFSMSHTFTMGFELALAILLLISTIKTIDWGFLIWIIGIAICTVLSTIFDLITTISCYFVEETNLTLGITYIVLNILLPGLYYYLMVLVNSYREEVNNE